MLIGTLTMDKIHRLFGRYPSQEAVADLLFRHGISVRDGFAYCGNIKQSDAAIARAAGVDRRVVRSTIDRIESVPELLALFSKLQSRVLLSDAARELGCSTVEVAPTDASAPGIMASVIDVIYRAGISIKQAVVEDPEEGNGSRLILVVDGDIPGNVLSALRDCRGVASINIR